MKHKDVTEGLNLVTDQRDPEEDTTIMSLKDTRKPNLTLKDLNKLRKMREKNKLNLQTDTAALELLYGETESEE